MNRDKFEYLFLRVKIEKAEAITEKLNKFGQDGWILLSHTEGGGEYSFSLVREAE